MTTTLHFDFTGMPVVSGELLRTAHFNDKLDNKINNHHNKDKVPAFLANIDRDQLRAPSDWALALHHGHVAAALKNPADFGHAIAIAKQRAQYRSGLILDETTIDLDHLAEFVDQVTRTFVTRQVAEGHMANFDMSEIGVIETEVYRHLANNIDELIRPGQEHNIVYLDPDTVYAHGDISLTCTIPVIQKFNLIGSQKELKTFSTGPLKDYTLRETMKNLANMYPEHAATQGTTGGAEFNHQHLKNSLAAYPKTQPDEIWTRRSRPFTQTVKSAITEAATDVLSRREDGNRDTELTHDGWTLDEAIQDFFGYVRKFHVKLASEWHNKDWSLLTNSQYTTERTWNKMQAVIEQSFDDFFDLHREYSIHTGPYDEATLQEAWGLWMKRVNDNLHKEDVALEDLYDNNVEMVRTLWAQRQEIPWSNEPFIDRVRKDCIIMESRFRDFCESEIRPAFEAEYLVSSKRW